MYEPSQWPKNGSYHILRLFILVVFCLSFLNDDILISWPNSILFFTILVIAEEYVLFEEKVFCLCSVVVILTMKEVTCAINKKKK